MIPRHHILGGLFTVTVVGVGIIVARMAVWPSVPFSSALDSGEVSRQTLSERLVNNTLGDGLEVLTSESATLKSAWKSKASTFVFEAWFRYNDSNDWRWIVGSLEKKKPWGIEVRSNDDHLGYVVRTTTGTIVRAGNTAVAPRQWHHVVWQWNGNVVQAFIDGKKDMELPLPRKLMGSVPAQLTIGKGIWDQDEQSFYGSIDEVRVLPRVLTVIEIQDRFQKGIAALQAVNNATKRRAEEAAAAVNADTPVAAVEPVRTNTTRSLSNQTNVFQTKPLIDSGPAPSTSTSSTPITLSIVSSRPEINAGETIRLNWLSTPKGNSAIRCHLRTSIGQREIDQLVIPLGDGTRDVQPLGNDTDVIYTYAYICPEIQPALVTVKVHPGAQAELVVLPATVDLGKVARGEKAAVKDVKIEGRCGQRACSPLSWTTHTETPFEWKPASGTGEQFVKLSADTTVVGTFEKTLTIRSNDQVKTVSARIQVIPPAARVLSLDITAPTQEILQLKPFTIGQSFRLVARATYTDGSTRQSDVPADQSLFRWIVVDAPAGLTVNPETGEAVTSLDPARSGATILKYVVRVTYTGEATPITMVQQILVQYRSTGL